MSDNDGERDFQEEEYWRNYCPECDSFPCTCEKKPEFFCVAVYLHDKCYGGPEEGGWWYSAYEPIHQYAYKTRCFQDRLSAQQYKDELTKWIEVEGLNEGRRPVSSVLSEGEYVSLITTDEYPHPQPKERPHYE
jgi:hypothetical protein